MKIKKSRNFANGNVYALELDDGMLVEVTETFLPTYTKNCINEHTNQLKDFDLGSRKERWMVGISTMSGCSVRCGFCATSNMKRCRNLTAQEMFDQVDFVLKTRPENFTDAIEHKVNLTRMGEPFLNIQNVKTAIDMIEEKYPNTHFYISTIGIKDSDFSWIKGNVTLQISLHSLDDSRRNALIPYKHKMTIEELGKIRTKSNLKTTVNMTLVDEKDFDIVLLQKYFPKEHFFIKVSPINPNEASEKNGYGEGIIKARNIL